MPQVTIGDTRLGANGGLEYFDGISWIAGPKPVIGPRGHETGIVAQDVSQVFSGPMPQHYLQNGTISVMPQAARTIQFETSQGMIKLDLDSGKIDMPPGIDNNTAVKEFWNGFSEQFDCGEKRQYEKKILALQQKIESMKHNIEFKHKEHAEKLSNCRIDVAKELAEKVRRKYGNEKFIMVKPQDLINFIAGEDI